MVLLIAYWPMLPTSQASDQRAKSMLVGGANGVEKMDALVLKLDRIIQISGKKKNSASRPSAADTSEARHAGSGCRRPVRTPGAHAGSTRRPRAWSRAYTRPTPSTIAVRITAIAEP